MGFLRRAARSPQVALSHAEARFLRCAPLAVGGPNRCDASRHVARQAPLREHEPVMATLGSRGMNSWMRREKGDSHLMSHAQVDGGDGCRVMRAPSMAGRVGVLPA